MKSLKHFAIGVLAIVIPVAPAIFESPAIQNFIAAHPSYAVYVPIAAGIVVEIFHKLWPTYKPLPPAPVIPPVKEKTNV